MKTLTLEQVIWSGKTAYHDGRQLIYVDAVICYNLAGTGIPAPHMASEAPDGWRHAAGCDCQFCGSAS